MNIKIQSVKFDADKKLIDFIENKVAKIDRFIDNIVSVAERQCKSFEEAVDSGLDAIRNQVDKYKEKLAK